jgi:hypothetical protein
LSPRRKTARPARWAEPASARTPGAPSEQENSSRRRRPARPGRQGLRAPVADSIEVQDEGGQAPKTRPPHQAGRPVLGDGRADQVEESPVVAAVVAWRQEARGLHVGRLERQVAPLEHQALGFRFALDF